MLAFMLACSPDSRPPEALPPLPPKVEKSAPTRGEAQPVRELTLALTGEVRGEIEPCGCPTVPYGGFARRARLYEELRRLRQPLFAADAGQMLLKGEVGADPVDRGVRARTVLDLAQKAGLDAWVASRVDGLADGGALLREGGALAANWEGWPVARTVERGGLRVQFFGVADTPPPGTAAREPVEAIRAAMEPGHDAYVLLSGAGPEATRELAERLPDLGLAVSLKGERADPPLRTAGAPVVEVPDRGRYVSLVRVALGSTPRAWTLDEAGLLDRLADARQTLLRNPRRRDAAWPQVKKLRDELGEAAAGLNLFTVEDRPLGSDLDGSSAVDASIRDFKARTLRTAAEAVAAAPAGPRQGGAASCNSCHSTRFAQWIVDPHARALDPLVKDKKEGDTECVACHTTGFGKAGGFADLDDVRQWGGVQCEACHGPMGGHPSDGSVRSAKIDEGTCVACHDQANSPQFDYATWLPRTSCVVASKLEPQKR